MKYHKHKGVESNGVLKSHPVMQHHKNPQVQKWHNAQVEKDNPELVPPKAPKKMNVVKVNNEEEIFEPEKLSIPGVVLKDDYLYVDITQLPSNIKAVRVKFVNFEADKKRTAGVEFKNRNY